MLSGTDKRILWCVFAWVLTVVIAVSLQRRIGIYPALGVNSLIAAVIAIYAFRKKPA